MIAKIKLSEIRYKVFSDFIIEVGSNYTVYSGILFLLSIQFIYRDWYNSLLVAVKLNSDPNYLDIDDCDDKQLMCDIKERVSFSGIYNMF